MKFTAAGDALCQKRMPQTYEGFEEICRYIQKGDARFFNLETTIHREGECYGCQHSGGTYVRCDPEVAQDMLRYGFNVANVNNNHIMDFAHDGLVKTLEYVKEMGIVHAGVGKNLHEAAAPRYLETPNGRVAIVSICTTFAPPCMAGVQSRRLPGRPGLNGIRIKETIQVPEEAFRWVQLIGEQSGINDPTNIIRAEGYSAPLPENEAELGDTRFEKAKDYGVKLTANPADVERLKASIEEACLQADYVMVSVHTHEIVGKHKETVPAVIESLCRSCIDFGAHAVIGHGPHLLRAIEVYQNKPIFYSLGDFVIQLYSVPVAPEDFYNKYGLNSDSSVIQLLKTRSKDFTRGLMEEDRMLESVIPYWETDENNNLTKLELLPVKAAGRENHSLEGLPQLVKDYGFMEKLHRLSYPYGVSVRMENGVGICSWNKGE